MKSLHARILSLVIVACVMTPTFAMSSESKYVKRTSKELDVLLAPIALYPDVLLAQIFPASTFPDQVTLAYHWVAIEKNDADQIDDQAWDDSIKALARYPDILKKMSQNMDWVSEMGDVFIHQQEDVMSSVQQLRVIAKAAGTLADTKEQKVVVVQEVIRIEPANPQIIYVPQYNPQVVYVENSSSVSSTDAARIGLLSFGAGVALGAWLNKDCDYHYGGVYYPRYGYGYGYGAVAGPHGAVARGPNGAIAVGPNGGVAVGRNGAAAWTRSTPYAAPRYNTAYRQNGNVNINVNNNRTVNNNINNSNINRNVNNSNTNRNVNNSTTNRNVNNSNTRNTNNFSNSANSSTANKARSTPTQKPTQNAAANTYSRGSDARKSSQRGAESRTPQRAAQQPAARQQQPAARQRQSSSGGSFGNVNRAPQARAQSSRGQASRGGGGGGRRR